VGGLGCFPLVRIASRRIRRCSVGSHHAAPKVPTMEGKNGQIGSVASIASKHRSDHRAAE